MRALNWSRGKIIVIGDIILDRFLYGRVQRISPEAPIPVLEVEREVNLPGGAGNVSSGIKALGSIPVLIGIIGNDSHGVLLRETLREKGLSQDGIIVTDGRPTTVKTRVVAQRQQVVRIDREKRETISDRLKKRLLSLFNDIIKGADGVVISDYAKGVISEEVFRAAGESCRKKGIPLIVDPKPFNYPYHLATVITPNQKEAELITGRDISSLDEKGISSLGKELISKGNMKSVLLTLGEKGVALIERNKKIRIIPAHAREVFDVTGAGDTIAATLSVALSNGLSLRESARIANVAAGIVVGKAGTATCSLKELENAMK